ncbi:MAG: esterase-like activity of phytase family protein [Chitinophagaceae bacterium]
MRILALISASITALAVTAQPMPLPVYSIENVPLPESMHKQVCISGMKYMNGNLYLASERCPFIFEANPSTGAINRAISIQVPQSFEMEGLTSYKNKLYGVSENLVAVYEINPENGEVRTLQTSTPLPPKSKSGDGMEGIAANETNNKFYLLRERNEDMTFSQIWIFSIDPGEDDNSFNLKYESMIELPLKNPQWRYSDICYDAENDRLLCLKSYSKGKLRQQFIESIDIDKNGNLEKETLKNINVDRFSEISNEYKDQDYSMNLEGITIDNEGNIWIVSDNTSGKAQCDMPAKEKTILLHLVKK